MISTEQIADLLRDHSDKPTEDLHTFTDALLFDWLIAGSDAHDKNCYDGPEVRSGLTETLRAL